MKMILILLLLVLTHSATAQNKTGLSVYAGLHNSITAEDPTKHNNPWGLGIFTAGYVNTGGFVRPTIEITAEKFIADNKVGVHDGFDGIVPRIDAMVTVLGGGAILFEKFLSAGFLIGPALLKADEGKTGFPTNKRLLIIKPYIDVTPGKGKLSFRVGYVKGSSRFESVSPTRYKAVTLGVGVRLFEK